MQINLKKFGNHPVLLDGALVGSLLCVGAWLRLPSEHLKFLGIDEAFHIFFASRPNLGGLFSALNSAAPQQYPLDYLLSFLPARWTTDIHMLRLLPMFWGILSLIPVFFLGKLILSRSYGFLWGWLLAISTIHIEYSQTFRPYSLILFLSSLSTLLFLKVFLQHSNKWIWPYALSSFLYQLAYPYAILKSLLELGFVWVMGSGNKKPLIRAILISSSIPALLFLAKTIQMSSFNSFHFAADSTISLSIVADLFFQFSQQSMSAFSLYLVLFGAGIISGLRHQKQPVFAYFILLFAGTLAAALLTLFSSRLFFNSRHVLALLPIYLGLICFVPGIILFKLDGRMEKQIWRILLLGTLVVAFSILTIRPLRHTQTNEKKITGELNHIAWFLKTELKKGDEIVFGDPNFGSIALYYIDGNIVTRLKGIQLRQSLNLFEFPRRFLVSVDKSEYPVFTLCSFDPSLGTIDIPTLIKRIKKSSQEGNRIWFVYLPFRYTPNDPLAELANTPSINLQEKTRGVFLLS